MWNNEEALARCEEDRERIQTGIDTDYEEYDDEMTLNSMDRF